MTSYMDRQHARFNTWGNLDLGQQVEWSDKAWDNACMVGMLVSTVEHGYPDAFDGVDWQDYIEALGFGYGNLPAWTLKGLLENLAEYMEGDAPQAIVDAIG